jgi:predicted nucleotidyltransferase
MLRTLARRSKEPLFPDHARAVCDNAGDSREELRAMGVDQLSLFGSVARDEAGEGSDVDILVQFAPGAHIGMFEFLEVQEVLASLLSAEVDLATPASLHPRLRDAILEEAILAA